jgi:hypothetical protein
MAPEAANRLPPPPHDLAGRGLPVKQLTGRVYRIHRIGRECVFFGKTRSQRFDDPLGEFGVLYGALDPEAAFAEVFLRQLSLMLVRELDLRERAVAEIACKNLQCVDLTGAGLRRVSCDNRIATEIPYVTTAQWSRAFFGHPQQPDGMIYRSRHNPRFKCVALFDRCRSKLSPGESEPLLADARRTWTGAQVAKHGLALEPAP